VLSYCPNAKLVTSKAANDIGSSIVDLWDLATGHHIKEIDTGHSVLGGAFSPDCKSLATGSFGSTISIVDVQTGEILFELELK
jgi:WD40 repeat protein